jgi:hypothetical protein
MQPPHVIAAQAIAAQAMTAQAMSITTDVSATLPERSVTRVIVQGDVSRADRTDKQIVARRGQVMLDPYEPRWEAAVAHE